MDYSISSLLEKPFATRSLEEKLCIVKTGKPKPAMPNLTSPCRLGSKMINRTFSSSRFNEVTWLTGCNVKNKLYCWLVCCLVQIPQFGTDKGIQISLIYLMLCESMRPAKKHIEAFFSMKMFGCQRIATALSSQRLAEVSHHNGWWPFTVLAQLWAGPWPGFKVWGGKIHF